MLFAFFHIKNYSKLITIVTFLIQFYKNFVLGLPFCNGFCKFYLVIGNIVCYKFYSNFVKISLFSID